MGTCGDDRERTAGWSAFDGVKAFRPSSTTTVSPETLMAEIDAAIAASEYAHATTLLRPFNKPQQQEEEEEEEEEEGDAAAAANTSAYDAAALADEAYKSACASLAAGKPDAALRSLQVALASCPPDKTSAISKLRSLVSFATSQQQRLLQKQKSSTSN